MVKRRVVLGLTALLCANDASPGPLSLIGRTTLPSDARAADAAVGGISGIDRDPRRDLWYLVSDDRSEHGPARYNVTTIAYDIGRPLRVTLTATIPLRSATGDTFPRPGTGGEASDAESIRVLSSGGLIWSSEGDARDGFGPAIRTIEPRATASQARALPAQFAFDRSGTTGPRPNLSIEGLTFAPRSKALWVSLEAPLRQDGQLASAASGATVRLTRFGANGAVDAQYAYRVEPIGPTPPGKLADNGVSEILAIDDTHLLVLERSGVEQDDHDFRYHVRLFCAAMTSGSDIRAIPALAGAAYRPVTKRLVLDFATLPASAIDNVEAMAWGHSLLNGHASLVFATDNDFSAHRATQFFAFDVQAKRGPAARVRALCGG